MDPETIYESLVTIIEDGLYKSEARYLFKDELFSCDALTNSEVNQIFDVLEWNYESKEDALKAAREIAPLLARCPQFGEFIKKKSVGK